ncbi:hypothetical protein [Arcicella rosea]|uniref:Gliding motility-associated C-terminal domain-containing protein n=1 Tax=Arcicella rosea TaxID=502909 RepID=A0A841EQG4_9BACT|nr:hypothetical protein [Arcicella rosea]MBB6005505.1 hypothetical protein [Arcicella rosea]
MKQLYIKVLFLIIFVIIKPIAIVTGNSSNNLNLSLFSVKEDKTEVSKTNSKGKEANPKKKVLAPKVVEKKRPLKAPSLLAPKPLNLGSTNTQFSHLLGPDPFMFTITSSKESVNIGEEFELSVRVSWLDFGINNGVRFLPEWYKYTLKVVMPDGFVQTGGNYEDYCTTPVNAENPTATFTIKGHFEFKPQEPTFKVLRGFEGANEKSEFIWKGEKRIALLSYTKSYSNEYQNDIRKNQKVSSDNCEVIPKITPASTSIGCAVDKNRIYDNKFGLSVVNKNVVCENGKVAKRTYDIKLKNFSVTKISTIRVLLHGQSTDECYGTSFSSIGTKIRHYLTEPFTLDTGKCYSTSIEVPMKDFKDIETEISKHYLHAHILFKTTDNDNIINLDLNSNYKFEGVVLLKPVISKEGNILTVTNCAGTVTWNNSMTGNPMTFTPTVATNYKAKCTQDGCSSDEWSDEININPCDSFGESLPLIIGANEGCKQIVLSSNIVGSGYTYQWKKDGINISGATLKDFTATSSGTYTLSVTKSGCTKISSAKSVIITTPSTPTISGSQTITETVKTATLTASGCTGSIIWNDELSSQGESITVSPNTTKTYAAKCKIGNCDSPWSSTVTVTVCNVEAPKVNSPIEYTKNAQATALTATALTGASLKWYSAEQLLSTAPIPNTSSVGSTNYFVSQVINGCESNKAKITVNVGDFPPLSNPSISKIDSMCSVTLKANTSESGVNYTWSYSANNANNYEVKSGINTSSYTTSITGYYKVEITKDNYKPATSNSIYISTISKTTTPSTQGSTTINRGESTNISASGCGGGIISWYNTLNLSYIIDSDSSLRVAPAVTTTYYAKCTVNGCESDLSSPVEIKVKQPCDIDIAKPIITSNRLQLDEQNPTAELTANGCSYTVQWYKSDGNYIADGMKLYNVGVGTYYAKCINRCPDGMVAEMNSDHINITKVSCPTTGYWPTITNNSTEQIGDETFCTSGTVRLSVTGCLDNSKAKWYGTNGNDLGTGSTYTETINSNQTFAVSCENHCKPSERLGWETINFTVIPYDLCKVPNPQIINNTPGRVTEFCGNGQFSVSASGCPDGNRVKWWVGDGSTVQGSDYVANITTTTWVSFRCISPVSGDLIGPEKYIIFTVKSFSDCNYAPAIINNTPGKKTIFCTKGWIDLTVTGCPNNNLVRWYADGTELTGGIGSTLRGTITRTSKIGITCLNPNDNTDFGWNEITFKVDNSGCDPNNPTIINNTSHGYNKFCKKGWVSLEVDGCPDNSKAKWYKDNIFIKQSAIYKEVINQTATYKVTCENPLYESSYSEIKFDILTNGDCYIPSIVNLTPNGQTDFCGSGTLKLMMTGCNTNYPPAFEEHVDGKPGRSIGGTWEMIDGVNTSVLNYNATESGYIKVICRTNESQNDYIWASQQIIRFNVNPVPSISATNTPACVGSQFSLNTIVPNLSINTGEIKFEWTNANNVAIGSLQNISLLADNSTPTTYNVKFTNNKGCSATASTTVTNYAKPTVSVSNSSITQCAGTILNLNSNATVGSGKATVQVKLEENLTNVDRSVVLSISGSMNPTPTSVTITQKGKTNTTCITCLNNNITDGQIIGYRDINQPNQKAIIKIENGCAKAWWSDFDENVHPDWIPLLKNKTLPDSILRSCINFYGFNNCANNKGCNQGSTSGITNFSSAGGITSFEITLPSVNGTWSVTKQTGSDKNWLSFVNAVSGSTSITGGGGLNYNWTKGTTFKSSLQNPSISNIQAADAGTYKVEVTDIRNCVGSANVNVVVDALPNATVSNTTPTTFCQGNSVVLSAVSGLTAYQWKKDGTNISGATAQTYTANASGTYTVQVTNNKNCSATSNGAATGKVVLVNPKPNLALAGTSKVCYGQSINILASGATTYAWTGPNSFTSSSANPIINAATTSSSGTYNLVGTSSAGCTSTSSFVATVLANPVITVTSNSPVDGLTTGETLNLNYASNPSITPISHKWTFNTDTVTLGRNATQTIANVYEPQGGTYKIVIEHDADLKCKAYGSLLVKIKPFVCKIKALTTPICYISENKRWAKLSVSISNRTKSWTGYAEIKRIKDADGNPVTDVALPLITWSGTDALTLPTTKIYDKILDGDYQIKVLEKRNDQAVNSNEKCMPTDTIISVGCQKKCKAPEHYANCGINPTPDLSQEIMKEVIASGDTIIAGDFEIIVGDVTKTADYTFKGLGYIKLPYLNFVKVKMVFENAKVNECNYLVAGKAISTYDPNWGGVVNPGGVVEDAVTLYKEVVEISKAIANVNFGTLEERRGKAIAKQLINSENDLPTKLVEEKNTLANRLVDIQKNCNNGTFTSAQCDSAGAVLKQDQQAWQQQTNKYKDDWVRIVTQTLKEIQDTSIIKKPSLLSLRNTKGSALGFDANSVGTQTILNEAIFAEETESSPSTIVDSKAFDYYSAEMNYNEALIQDYFTSAIKSSRQSAIDLANRLKANGNTQKMADFVYNELNKNKPDRDIVNNVKPIIKEEIKNILIQKVYNKK